MTHSAPSAQRSSVKGFSLIEMVFVSAAGLAVLSAAVLVFKAVATQRRNASSFTEITIGRENLHNFYYDAPNPDSSSSRKIWVAPNPGRFVRAQELRQVFFNDVNAATAVFALPRAGRSNAAGQAPIRPSSISFDGGNNKRAGFTIDTPNKFLAILIENIPSAAQVFSAYEGVPTPTSANLPPPSNASIFITQPTPNEEKEKIAIRCIWEIDFVEATPTSGAPAGVYATVRRYQGDKLTHYYDVFYDRLTHQEVFGAANYQGAAEFGPVFVCFERAQRGEVGNAFRKAKERPYYFIWWPDPSTPTLRSTVPPSDDEPRDLANTPIKDHSAEYSYRLAYAAHYGQTSLFFVVPMFPNL